MNTIDTFEDGYRAGQKAAILLIHPVKKEESKECDEASKKYKYCILQGNPTLWEQGYMDGFNSVLEENRKKKS